MNNEIALKISQPLIDVIENEGIKISGTYQQDNGIYTELEFWSDLGEDVIVTIWHDNTDEIFADSMEQYALDFDAEEHAVEWYNAKDTVSGVPHSLHDLLKDADEIKDKLYEVAFRLQDARKAA